MLGNIFTPSTHVMHSSLKLCPSLRIFTLCNTMIILNFNVLVESLSISQYLEKYLKNKLVQFEVREGN